MFRARGVRKSESGVEGKLEGNVEIFCSFDHANGLFRFDRTEPGMRLIPGNEKAGRDSWKLVTDGGKFVSTPKETIVWAEGQPSAGILPEGKRAPDYIKPFDARALGLYLWGNFVRGSRFEQLHTFFSKQEFREVVEEKPGIYRLECVLQTELPVLIRFWIDEQKGFAPVRFESSWANPKLAGQWQKPEVVNETSWEEVTGVWVPRSFRIQRDSGQRKESYELSIQWEKINTPQPPELFTKEGLELKLGTYFMDTRSGKPIVVGAAGIDKFPRFGPEGPLPDDEPPKPAMWRLIAVWATAGLTLLSFAGVGACWYRRRRRAPAA
jgi:hypothetical protein